jgi:tetratricopeptide (TPR) repeat protein
MTGGILRSFVFCLAFLAVVAVTGQKASGAEVPAAGAASLEDNHRSASATPIEETYRGIRLVALPPRPGATYELTIATTAQAIENLKKAIDLMLVKSPFTAEAVKTLQDAGKVVIVYSPDFRAARNGLFTLATFSPDYFKPGDPKRREFMVQLGRHLILYPIQEIAATLVHELVGHGIQHLKGWTSTIREIDLECNAELYRERFFQDIGVDKLNEEIVKFRKALEEHWCDDFKIYMKANTPAQLALWDQKNPDVPKLLAFFERYTESLQKSGEAAKALAASRELQQREREAVLKKAEDGDAEAQYAMGQKYLKGFGVDQDHKQAAIWFYKSASQGYALAQTEMGLIYANGHGVERNYATALTWLNHAIEAGDNRAKPLAEKVRELLAKARPTR